MVLLPIALEVFGQLHRNSPARAKTINPNDFQDGDILIYEISKNSDTLEEVVEKNAKTFEDAVVDCADILKEKLVKVKEKRAE